MWFIILTAVICCIVFATALYFSPDIEDVVYGFVGMFAFFMLLVSFPAIKATTGFYDGYSIGERTGYIVKISHKGVLWKTTEVEMQLSQGANSFGIQPFVFSTADPLMLGKLLSVGDKKVTVYYSQWLMQPYSEGESGYRVEKIK